MLEGVRVHVSPDGDTELVIVTVPVNPLTGATVIVELAAVPTLTLAVVGLAVTEKSGTATLYVTVAACDRVPVTPVTVTVKLPLVDAVQESAEPPEPVTLVGASVQTMPVAGLLWEVKLTVPAKPLAAATVIVDVPNWLTLTGTLVGLAEIVKS
jgi:hypothetical protein